MTNLELNKAIEELLTLQPTRKKPKSKKRRRTQKIKDVRKVALRGDYNSIIQKVRYGNKVTLMEQVENTLKTTPFEIIETKIFNEEMGTTNAMLSRSALDYYFGKGSIVIQPRQERNPIGYYNKENQLCVAYETPYVIYEQKCEYILYSNEYNRIIRLVDKPNKFKINDIVTIVDFENEDYRNKKSIERFCKYLIHIFTVWEEDEIIVNKYKTTIDKAWKETNLWGKVWIVSKGRTKLKDEINRIKKDIDFYDNSKLSTHKEMFVKTDYVY